MDKNFDVYEVQTVLYWIVDVGDFDISGKNYTIELWWSLESYQSPITTTVYKIWVI